MRIRTRSQTDFKLKQFCHTLIVLFCTVTSLFAQVTLFISSATPEVGETFDIDITVEGFDSLSSASFRLKWDPTVIRLDAAMVPVDTIMNNSPFRTNSDPNRITFLYENSNGVGADGSLPNGSKLLRLSFTAIGNPGDSVCLMVDPSGALEFIKLASEELSTTVVVGCVHLQGVNSIPSHEQQNLNCHWQSNEQLIVNHYPSASPAFIQVFSLDGRVVKESFVAPHTTNTPVIISHDWQRSVLAVRYSRDRYSYTRLIAGPR